MVDIQKEEGPEDEEIRHKIQHTGLIHKYRSVDRILFRRSIPWVEPKKSKHFGNGSIYDGIFMERKT